MGGNEHSYDWFMLIPIISKLGMPFVLLMMPMFRDEDALSYKIVLFILLAIASTMPYLIRAYNNCNKLSSELFVRGCLNGTITTIVANILIFILGFLPGVGTAISMMQRIPVIGKFINAILWSVCFGVIYIITNLINQRSEDSKCNPKMGRLF